METSPEAGPTPDWDQMTRWERAEAGRSLRRKGWTYGEIMAVLPVGKGTLSGWCRDIRLTEEQIEAIKARVPSQKGVPKDTNWRRRTEVEAIRARAATEVQERIIDSFWVAGVVLYWAEGDKTSRRLSLVNTDPRALNLFIRWIRNYHEPHAEFVLGLHLHAGNVESDAKTWWRAALSMPVAAFHKTFIKPPGTGHRKNHLAHGVCRVVMRRSGDAWQRTMVWIDRLSEENPSPLIDLVRVASSTAEQIPLKDKAAGSNPARPTIRQNQTRA